MPGVENMVGGGMITSTKVSVVTIRKEPRFRYFVKINQKRIERRIKKYLERLNSYPTIEDYDNMRIPYISQS